MILQHDAVPEAGRYGVSSQCGRPRGVLGVMAVRRNQTVDPDSDADADLLPTSVISVLSVVKNLRSSKSEAGSPVTPTETV